MEINNLWMEVLDLASLESSVHLSPSTGPMSYEKGDSYGSQPRDFAGLIQTCGSNIYKITQNTAQIKSLVNQLGTKQDTSELQDRLQQIQHYTNQLAKETNRHLKDLGSLPPPVSPSEQRQQKLQRDRLMNEFSAALNNFQAVQRRAAEKEKESVARARAASRLSVRNSFHLVMHETAVIP
ncbi:hypothetical protein JZ751_024047 [Albula glossodonta]|uniref:Syntaxin N-terminal domain-containing protein n=1 Tax=Albula glossodonta TaxID=121402 RepID=A0A8T2NG27_9TELE|nr:hypothetical protein JZ751_024047 [Albula glossodonta]